MQQTAHLAYLMQKNDVLISDIKDALNDAVDKLRDIQKEETELPSTSECNEYGNMIIKVEAITWQLQQCGDRSSQSTTDFSEHPTDCWADTLHTVGNVQATSSVERGFSAPSRLLVPRVMLRINLPVLKGLDENYEEKHIKKAVR